MFPAESCAQTSPQAESATSRASQPSPVADLLQQSRAAHLRKKYVAGRADKQGRISHPPDYPQAESHIAEALRLRLEAEALDPEHTDPAWSTDLSANKGVSSADLIAFFRAYPAIP